MPYVSQIIRDRLRDGHTAQSSGELNYLITELVLDYLESRTLYKKTYSYTDLNDILGALEGAKLEFYRRVVVPYEEKKLKENGDVY